LSWAARGAGAVRAPTIRFGIDALDAVGNALEAP
jgi:hypothetical protein